MANAKSDVYVIIAEDDVDDRMVVSDAFAERHPDIQISFVSNGEDLLQLLNDTQSQVALTSRALPSLILLDLNMPKKDGREALLEIKASPDLRDIPVVVLTTSSAKYDADQCNEIGVADFMTKPSSYIDLLRFVDHLRRFWAV